jgi:hypothetical protein
VAQRLDAWKEYEQDVRRLLLGKLLEWFPQVPNRALKVYGERALAGAKGRYKIDISAEIHFGDLRLLFLVECRYWNSRVPQDAVLSLRSKVEDVGAHKGIIASLVGFQSGAVRVARANGIALWHYHPGSPSVFEAVVAIINWERLLSGFRATCVKWVRGIEYNPTPWHFEDNNGPYFARPAGFATNLKKLAASLWPVWVFTLFKGREE